MAVQYTNLNQEKHRDLGFKRGPDYRFAADMNAVAVGLGEIETAARYFPIAFLKEGPPVAILGSQSRNRFVDDQGRWTAGYVPAMLRQYPFILGQTDKADQFQLLFDENASQIVKLNGDQEVKALFDGEGALSSDMQQVQSFLQQVYTEGKKAEALTGLLREQGLLTDRQITVNEGETRRALMSGFQTVDMDKFRALDGAVLADWNRRGLLGVVFAHAWSMANLPKVFS